MTLMQLGVHEMLILRGNSGTIGMVKAGPRTQYYIETEKDEIVMFLDPEDLLVASGFGTNKKIEKGLKCLLYMIREVGAPLIVLPKNHPASPRLPLVVSVGNKTVLNCKIIPGTHPEQDVLCGPQEFDGVEIYGVPGGVEFKNLNSGTIERTKFSR
ncbi:MAG: hypothetical protein ACE5J3_08025 [Methanosarcinales archaeon]